MTTQTEIAPGTVPPVGTIVHVLESVLIPFGPRKSDVVGRGGEFIITDEMVEFSKDRNGGPGWLAIIGDPDRQIGRWGHVRLALGEFPEDEAVVRPNSALADEFRAREMADAQYLPAAERDEAIQLIVAKYGRPTQSRTLNKIRGER